MPDFPPVCVIIPTYNRAATVIQTVRALRRHLRYPGEIHYYLGDDGTDNACAYVSGAFGPEDCVQCYESPKRGLGANLNFLIVHTTEPLLLQLDDDHLLHEPLDLVPHANQLLTHPDAGWIRLMGIGSHRYAADLRDLYWYVHWDSPELYIPSNRPHLKHRRFIEQYGLYAEGLKLGETEDAYCHQCIARAHASGYALSSVLVPLNSASETAWQHVGESWQGKGY